MELIQALVWAINNNVKDDLSTIAEVQYNYKVTKYEMLLAINYSDIPNKNLAFSYLTDKYDFYG